MTKNAVKRTSRQDDYWIFAYSSLLSSITDGTTANQAASVIPCRLQGWQRNWSAIRKDKPGNRKRFVDAHGFDPVNEYAFASVASEEGAHVNGIAYRVDVDFLDALDYREEGYRRVDVTAQIEPYEGYQLNGKVGVYVDEAQAFSTAPVSFEYVNMGIWGAAKWDAKIPGFLREYCATSPLPPGALADMRFVFVGPDGRTVWLLHMQSEMKTLLVLLPASIFPDSTIQPENTADWRVPCPKEWQVYDYRYRFEKDVQQPAQENHVLADMVEAIWSDTPQDYLQHDSWLVRLGCLAGFSMPEEQVRMLASDPDDWVARAARALLAIP